MNPAQLERLADHLTSCAVQEPRAARGLAAAGAAEDMAYADFLEQVLAEESRRQDQQERDHAHGDGALSFVKPLETFDFAYQPDRQEAG